VRKKRDLFDELVEGFDALSRDFVRGCGRPAQRAPGGDRQADRPRERAHDVDEALEYYLKGPGRE